MKRQSEYDHICRQTPVKHLSSFRDRIRANPLSLLRYLTDSFVVLVRIIQTYWFANYVKKSGCKTLINIRRGRIYLPYFLCFVFLYAPQIELKSLSHLALSCTLTLRPLLNLFPISLFTLFGVGLELLSYV